MDDHKWYAKYIAEFATSHHGDKSHQQGWFASHYTPETGWIVIANPSIAPVFLAAITLAISISTPLLLARIPRAFAIAWLIFRWRDKPDETKPNSNRRLSWHLPVLLANSGQFLSDGYTALVGFWSHARHKDIPRAVTYLGFAFFCLAAVVLGPLVALLVSRNVVYGFAGPESGPCYGQLNFTVGATNNLVARALDHHMRSYELVPWVSTFNYAWTENNTDYTTADRPVVQPISGVTYRQLPGCLLGDDVLCDSRFNRTHHVSVTMSPARLGLWYDDTWKFELRGYCVRLNSTAISRRTSSSINTTFTYNLGFAPGGVRHADLSDHTVCPLNASHHPDWRLGQAEDQRFDRRLNIIADSFFVNSDLERGFPCYQWRESLRALDSDGLTVLTVLPPRDANAITHPPGDELDLPPIRNAAFGFGPGQVAHILCWEDLHVHTEGGIFKTSGSW